MADDKVLDVEHVTKRYGRATVVSSVSFDLGYGVIAGLLGPNGAGKSTCLHMITGLVTPDAGQVRVGGLPAPEPLAKLQFGFAPDDLPLPGALTGREYLSFHDRLRGRSDLARGMQIMEAFDIAGASGQQIAEYSHGMKRKIQLASAIMHSPDLLILDEPFRGLDPDAVAVLDHFMRAMAQDGKTVLMATHDLARAEAMCQQVVILDRGQVAGVGAPTDLVREFGRDESLETAFMTMTGRESDAERKKQLMTQNLRETPQ